MLNKEICLECVNRYSTMTWSYDVDGEKWKEGIVDCLIECGDVLIDKIPKDYRFYLEQMMASQDVK